MGKATSAASTDGFLKLLQQSGLLAGAAWERAVELSKAAPDLRTAARTLVKENLLTLWQAKQIVSGFADLKFGRYKLLDELGQSEVGRVFLAEHGQLNRRVALKILSRRLTADPAAVERFLGEARVLAALNHRNLIHVFDVGQEDRKYYLVFEYAQGRDAQKLVAQSGPLSAADSARLIRQAAAGLSAAHERGVSHGDLKPGHFWVDEGGNVKVLDLGIAQLGRKLANSDDVGDDEPTQPSKSAELAPHYLAADQLAGSEATPAGDLYSLGAVWHLLLTGEHPSTASGAEVVSEVARRTLSARHGIPAEVVDMVATLLSAAPDQRGGSAADWCQRIDAWLATQPTPTRSVEKRPATAPVTASKPGVKRPLVRAKSLDETAATAAVPIESRWRSGDGSDDAASVGEESPAGGEGAFIIRTRQKRSRPEKDAKNATTAGSNSAVGKRSRALLIGGAVGGGLLLVGGLALAWQFWPPDNKSNGRPSRQVVKGAEATTPSESDLARGFRMANESPPADAPPGAENPPPPPGDPPNPNPAPPPNPNPATNPPVDPAKPSDPVPAPAGATPPAEPKPPAAKPPETKPSEPKPAEPPPGEPKPAEPKPAEPKPEAKVETPQVAKPESPAASIEPFSALPAAVNLPALALEGPPTPPQLLGKIAIGPQAICVVHLLGGADLNKGKQKLALEAAENGTALRDWEIFVREKTAESGGKKVAHLALKNGELTFAWTADAAAEPLAPLLANCMLNLASGAKSQAVALRTALVGEPLSIDLLKTATGKWDIPAAPDPDKILLEISVAGPLPPHGFKGDQPMKADKGNLDVQIKFGDRPDDADFLTVKLETSMKKALQLSATAWIRPLFYPKAEKLTVANLKKARQLSASAQATIYGNLEQLKKTGAQDEVTKGNIARLEEGNTLALRTGQHLEQVQQMTQAQGASGVIHVRAYYLADGKRVNLLTTDSAPANVPAPPAPPQP